jgi:hypothetical protein
VVSGRLKFSRNETLTIYITCLFSTLVPGHGGENFFVATLIGPYYYATPENKWMDFLGALPSWFTPALSQSGKYDDAARAVVSDWYTGNGGIVPWAAWLVPLLAWGAFVFASYVMLGCLSVMLRAQWAEREALAFPLLRLPLEMTRDESNTNKSVFPAFFRNPLMWVGFGIGVFIQMMNGLHTYYADVPAVPLEINTGPLFTEAPWNQLGWVPMRVLPIAVGVTYLLTSEVSFSLWFFYWFIKAQLIFAFFAGFPPASLPKSIGHLMGPQSFTLYQQVGAYLAYVALVLWGAREHLKHVMSRAFGRTGRTEEERKEALSYPVAFWGFVLSFSFMVVWSVAAGISPEIAIGLWTIYLVIALALTRVVVEGGLLFVQQGWTPFGTLAQLTGSEREPF